MVRYPVDRKENLKKRPNMGLMFLLYSVDQPISTNVE
jgi:hypothetical protein